MKRNIRIILIVFIFVAMFSSTAYADFSGNTPDYTFNRGDAEDYMETYWDNYNTNYADFSSYGGDCTNYASQIMFAAGVTFTSRSTSPTYNHWYYYGSTWGWDRTSTWTGATQFRQHFGDINGTGKKRAVAMRTYTVSYALDNFYDVLWLPYYEGDVISHGHSLSTSYHSQIVYDWTYSPTYDLRVSQHTGDYLQRSLKDYLQYRENYGEGDEYIFCIEMW